MTRIRIAEDRVTKLERLARAQGIADIDSPADIQALIDGITNLATARIVIAKILISLLALRARLR